MRLELVQSQPKSDDDTDLLEGLQGSDTVPLESAAVILGYDVRYATRLRNEGKLKHASKRPDRITVASLRAYLAIHGKRRKDTLPSSSNGQSKNTQPLDNLVPLEV